MMRLGLDARLTYYTRGGIAHYIRQLAAYLPTLAPEHTHIHLYRRGHAETFNARARRINCWTPAHHRWERWALSAEIAPLRLDVLHSPDFIPPQWGYRHSVITVHDLTFLHHPEFLTVESRRYYNAQIRWAVRHCHAISADSQATKDDLVNLLAVPPEKITVIHLGLGPEYCPLPSEIVAPTLNRLGLSAGYVLFVGTFEPRKNVPSLLRAYALLRQRAPDAPPLVLVGNTGWLFAETMRRVDELGLKPHIRFFENLPNADLPAVYNGAGVLTLPSHYEGFGFPVLEAMGCGVPCVIAERASLPEIAGGAALLINPDDTEALADALHHALSDSHLRAALRAKGLARAQHFSWEKTARETLQLYAQVL